MEHALVSSERLLDELPFRSRSRVEGDKRTERAEIEHGPCPCQKQLDGDDHGSGVEVSGSVVSVPPAVQYDHNPDAGVANSRADGMKIVEQSDFLRDFLNSSTLQGK